MHVSTQTYIPTEAMGCYIFIAGNQLWIGDFVM